MYNTGGAPQIPPQPRKTRGVRPTSVDPTIGPSVFRAPHGQQGALMNMPIMQSTPPRVQPAVTQIPPQPISTTAPLPPRNVLLTQPQGQYMHRAPTVFPQMGLLPVQTQLPGHQAPYMFQQQSVFPPPGAAAGPINLQLPHTQQMAPPAPSSYPRVTKPPTQRKSHAVRIINPNTMKEVDVAPSDSGAPPPATQPAPGTTAPSEFQRKVHEAAALTPPTSVAPPPAPNAIIRSPEDVATTSQQRNGSVIAPPADSTIPPATEPTVNLESEKQERPVSSESPPAPTEEEPASSEAPPTGQATAVVEAEPEQTDSKPSVEAASPPARDEETATEEPAEPQMPESVEPVVPFVSEQPVPAEPVSEEKPSTEEPVSDVKPSTEEPVSDVKPSTEEPVSDEKPSTEEPVSEEKPSAEEPVSEEKPSAVEPVSDDEKPLAVEPVSDEKPLAVEPVSDEKPSAEEPVIVVPLAEETVSDEKPVGVDETRETIAEPASVEEPVELASVKEAPAKEAAVLEKPAVAEQPVVDEPRPSLERAEPAAKPLKAAETSSSEPEAPAKEEGLRLSNGSVETVSSKREEPPPSLRMTKTSAKPTEKPKDGRTTYERDFLLKFKPMQQCQQPPYELQRVSSDLYKPNALKDVFTFSSSSDRGGDASQSHGRKSSRRGSEPKKIIHQPMKAEKVDLHKADQRWTRPQERLLEVSEESKATTELYRKFQGILNKLTPQKFQSLAEKSLDLEISTEDRLRGCIDMIFTKALEEPNFSIAYANLCKVLSPIKVDWTDEEGKSRATNFRRVLLNKCQQEFEKDKKDDDNRDSMQAKIAEAETPELKKQLEEELAASEIKNQKRSLGNIRFIGELFKLKMLSETIMHECIVRLLRSSSDEESLECFSRLITTTGKDLDHPQAKIRIDNYFARINDIIKKGKIPNRIKFMLQDVQALRKNDWVPRSRQDNTLKTIDQIHAEAKAEEERDKQIVAAHHMMGSMKPGGGGGGGSRDDRRRGSKADEWTTKGAVDKDKRGAKVDTNRIRSIITKREKSKEPTLGPPGGGLRPNWKNPAAPAHDSSKAADKDKHGGSGKPSRSSSSGSSNSKKEKAASVGGGRGSGSLPKRAQTVPDSQREQQAALAALKQHINPDRLSEDEVRRRTATILDELYENKDFKEAVECVQELGSPGVLSAFASEAINHTLEKSSGARTLAGQLLEKLVAQSVMPQQAVLDGFNEVLEVAEDMAIDIPRIWEYLAEVLVPLVAAGCVSLVAVSSLPCQGVPRPRLASLLAQVLRLHLPQLKDDQELKSLWADSQLQWHDFGIENTHEFLSQLGLDVLVGHAPSPQPDYQQRLAQLFSSSDTTNDEVFDWIEEHCSGEMVKSAEFVRALTTAVVQATVSGSGSSAQYEEEVLKRRVIVIQKYVDDSKILQLEVLYALQIAVAQLEHPPRLLNQLFNLMYDVEVVAEDVFVSWRDHGKEGFGKGNAVQSVKTFFEWLESAETESDDETGS